MSLASVTANLSQTSTGISQSINKVTSGITDSIQETSQQFTQNVASLRNDITKTLQPVSSFTGQTLATVAGITSDPFGSLSLLPQYLAELVERVNPQFAARLEATFKSQKMSALTHLPSQLAGSIRHLLTFVDAALAVPIGLIADVYQGLMDVMEAISDAVDQAMAAVYNFIFGPEGLLDNIIPQDLLMSILSDISSIAGEIGGIAGAFLGSNPISQFTLSIQSYTGQIGSFIQNPANALFAYAPPQLSQALYTLRNPQQMINSVLPPQLSQAFSKVSSITGFGFNGNMGQGFGAVLQNLRQGPATAILQGFSNQYGLLGPLVGSIQGGAAAGAGAGTAGGGTTSLTTSPVNPNL